MKTALLLTGSYRTFDYMYKYINNNLVIPNDAIIFIYAEHSNEKDFDNKFNKNNIGTIKILSSCKTEEYKTILKQIKLNLEREEPQPEIWKFFEKHPGNIIELFQFMKCHQLMEEYETVHNFKFDIVIRCRLDSSVAIKLYISNFFSKINEDLMNQYGRYVYKKAMGNEKLCYYYQNLFKDESIRKIYYSKPINEKPMDNKDILQWINNDNKTIWTFYTNIIWVFKRDISDILSNAVYKYGTVLNKDGNHVRSGEEMFAYYVKSHNIDHNHVFTDTDMKYINAIVYPDDVHVSDKNNNNVKKRSNDFKDLTFDEPDLFLIRLRQGLPPL